GRASRVYSSISLGRGRDAVSRWGWGTIAQHPRGRAPFPGLSDPYGGSVRMTGDPAPIPPAPASAGRTPIDPAPVARRYGRTSTGSRRAQWSGPRVGASLIALVAVGVNALLTRGPSVT